MATFTELQLGDGTPVRFEVTSPSGPAPEAPEAAGDLPDGMGHSVPVARGGGQAVAAFAVETLRTALRPMGVLLQEVHDAVTASPSPPHEVNVTFGVQVGHDLKLGIVGGNGQAHLTVSATWQPAPPAQSPPPEQLVQPVQPVQPAPRTS
ncbi:CU044_2847 family protein [Streptomyces sp. NPDC058746]|uniref:CU044_2847 family protein n=1 Tax=Streptomyces sp. NPDC058746 TaxID=3346622 RepID=UPI0036A887AF